MTVVNQLLFQCIKYSHCNIKVFINIEQFKKKHDNMHHQQFAFLFFCCVFVAGLVTAASQQVSYRQYSASSLTLKQGEYINVPKNASKCKPITFLDLCDCKGKKYITISC